MRSYIFATYKTDNRKFKIRNRVLLGFFFLLLVYFAIPSTTEEKFIKPVVEEEEELVISTVSYTLDEIKTIISEEVEVLAKEEYSYFIQIGTIVNLDSFQFQFNKLEELRFNYKIIENTNNMVILVGPFDGYSKAKQHIGLIKSELNINDAFIRELK